jgi:hypothetical protein
MAARVLNAGQAQCRATQQRNAFRFLPRGGCAASARRILIGLRGVAGQDMRQLVGRRFVRRRIERGDGDRTATNEGERLGVFGAVLVFACALHGDRLTQHDGLFAATDMPAKLLPPLKRRDRAGLDFARDALRPREKLIADAVAVKRAVCLRDDAGLPYSR